MLSWKNLEEHCGLAIMFPSQAKKAGHLMARQVQGDYRCKYRGGMRAYLRPSVVSLNTIERGIVNTS